MTMKSLFNQNETYSAEDFRALPSGIFGSEGVLYGFGYTVDSATALTFDPGVCVAHYDNNTPSEPYYVIRSDDDETQSSISAPTGSNYRTYIFYAVADDSYVDGAGADTPSIGSVSNDNVGSYVDPSLPDNSVALLKVQMVAGNSLTSGATFTDMRTPPLPWNDTGWIDYTPTWINVTLGNGTSDGRYRRVGNTVEMQVHLEYGSTTSITSDVRTALPWDEDTLNGVSRWQVSGMWYNDSSGDYIPLFVRTVSNSLRFFGLNHSVPPTYATAINGTDEVDASVPSTWATGDSLTATFTYITDEPFNETAFT